MRRRRLRRSRTSGGLKVLALFAILVGAILFAGSFSGTSSAAEQPAPSGPSKSDVRRALEHLELASHSLEATDYGRTRFHLREVQRYLAQGN